MSQPSGITVSYFGVHQAFQLALAAQELGRLDKFYCSMIDAPGKWGWWLGKFFGKADLINRRCAGLDPRFAFEIPGPLIRERLSHKFSTPQKHARWFQTSIDFDRRVAGQLRTTRSKIFIGTETCARDSFRVAGKIGLTKILDCPQAHPQFLHQLLAAAAEDLRLPPFGSFDSPEIRDRKLEEFETADILLMISEFQQQSFLAAGFPAEKLFVVEWGIDVDFWRPPATPKKSQKEVPLRLLFVGSLGFRKGIPYLMQALDKCDAPVELAMVGVNNKETDRFISGVRAPVKYLGTKNKVELREIYWESDVLVLPSLVDTYGLVALEAMACGLPVIVTENCGVPVPDPGWRVPIMNSNAIAQRLENYAKNREALVRDGQSAQQFARQFTPQRYRKQIKDLLQKYVS